MKVIITLILLAIVGFLFYNYLTHSDLEELQRAISEKQSCNILGDCKILKYRL